MLFTLMVCPAGDESAAVTYTMAPFCAAVYVFRRNRLPVILGAITPSSLEVSAGNPTTSKVALGVSVLMPTCENKVAEVNKEMNNIFFFIVLKF